jgi:putative acyl-CoA dehydrogenase
MFEPTHTVDNQSSPWQGVNTFEANAPMRSVLAALAPKLSLDALTALGAQCADPAWHTHARLANAHKPTLHTHDVQGRRIDQVEFHSSYHALLGSALSHGLGGAPWGVHAGPHAHLTRAAGFMLFTELEPAVLCPVSMTYASTPALAGNAALSAAWHGAVSGAGYAPELAAPGGKPHVTLGMGMTEKQGGSDVRANTTRAVPDGVDDWGQRVRLVGHKWFFSAPMCDAFLVLAQTHDAPDAAQALTCYFMPRMRPAWLGGGLNAIRIQRLKDKLGNHANASSEVELEAAHAWQVGEVGRGIAQILEMGTLTRLDCALGTAGLMRQATTLAIHHARQRSAFGQPLAQQPLMAQVLADIALESEAATTLALRLAHAFDGQASSEHERKLARLLTPVAKFWVCKRGALLAQEAMECLGGNGYVEAAGQGLMARIYREMPLNSIWEGAGNIMALDLLRAIKELGGVDATTQLLLAECKPAQGAHPALDLTLQRLGGAMKQWAQPTTARRLAEAIAITVQAAWMARTAPAPVFKAFADTRVAGGWGHTLGAPFTALNTQAVLDRALPA